jgi:UDP-N-acetylmuramate--alanine ligase
VVVFQPHRYSRTQEFLNEFAKALSSAHTVLLAPIYSAGEVPITGIDSHTLGKCLQRLAPDCTMVVADTMDQLTALVQEHSKPKDLVLAMGAGDVNSLWSRLCPTENSKTSNPASTLAA